MGRWGPVIRAGSGRCRDWFQRRIAPVSRALGLNGLTMPLVPPVTIAAPEHLLVPAHNATIDALLLTLDTTSPYYDDFALKDRQSDETILDVRG